MTVETLVGSRGKQRTNAAGTGGRIAWNAHIDPKTQVLQAKTVCVVSCQRSPEAVFLHWKGMEAAAEGDFFVRSGPGTVKLPPDSAREYIKTRFRTLSSDSVSNTSPHEAV